jgi:hypothetical protein
MNRLEHTIAFSEMLRDSLDMANKLYEHMLTAQLSEHRTTDELCEEMIIKLKLTLEYGERNMRTKNEATH